MKNIKLIFLFFVVLLISVGCGKEDVDPLSQDTMDKIDTIGDVTIEDQKLIENLMETYSQMTDEQKNQVKNYVTLKNDKEKLDELLEAKAEEEKAKAEEEKEKKFEKQRLTRGDLQEICNKYFLIA